MPQTINLILNAVATGTVDAITVTYSPAITALENNRIYAFITSGANASTTPTLNINTLGGKTIKKKGGVALVAGDLAAAGAQVFVSYRLTGDYFELVNAATSGITNSAGANVIPKSDGTNLVASTATDNGTTFGITSPVFYYKTGSDTEIYGDATNAYMTLDQLGTRYVLLEAAKNTVRHDVENLIQGPLLTLNATNVNLPNETASLILSLDGSKNIKGLSTATYPSLVELAYLKGVTSAIQAQLDASKNRKMVNYENTTQSNTGSTTENIIINLLISANSMGANDKLVFQSQIGKSGTAGIGTFRAYLGPTSGSLVGATLIATTQLTALNLSGGFMRRVTNKNSQTTNEVFPSGQVAGTDDGVNTNAYTSTNIDFTVNQYLIMTLQNANAGDTTSVRNIQLYIDKP